jgi:5-methyltetrahydropteroyltriglutamate--homocysteine methyltransferase
MAGFDRDRPQPAIMKTGGVAFPMGHILHDYLEARVMPQITGPIGRGDLQYAAMWKTAQRLTKKPVKFGTITPELLAAAVDDRYYKDPVERIYALGNAINEELTELADAGCPVIQLEEPQIHMIPARGKVFGKLDMAEMVDVFNNTVKGLRDKTEVWCHTCWGNPSQQRMFKDVQSYAPSLEFLNQVDADVITFESCSSGHIDIAAIGERITDKKVAIGVIDHHSLQVEKPDEIAGTIRTALKHIPAERLILCSDCGMGREGMSRRHARYKMVSLVQGTNIVRKELGLPEAECLAADDRYSLVVRG